MALWMLRPTAQEDAAQWQGRRIWRKALVRASSSGEARLVATALDVDPEAVRNGNESHSFRSGFVDEKLYRVDWVGEDDGESEVLSATEGPVAPN